MNQKLHDYFNAPIPSKIVFGVIITQSVVHTIISVQGARNVAKKANKIIAKGNENLAICRESMDFLLEHADPEVVAELDKKLDYWRIVKDLPTSTGGE